MTDLRTLSNAKQKLLRKLQRRKYRQKNQAFIVEGSRAVEQVLNNGQLSVQWLLFDQDRRLWEEPVWQTKIGSEDCYQIDRGSFVELADTEHPQGVLAVCGIPEAPSLELLLTDANTRRLVVLDELQDPGNLGTIIRSAVWFGVDALILGKGTVDPWNSKVVRSTAGATGAIPLLQLDLEELPNTPGIENWQCWRMEAAENSKSLKMLKMPERILLVVGNEGNGIRHLPDLPQQDSVVIQPGTPQSEVESLNAGVATSIALFAIS
jgi:TrmH family RNA methyltransferase